jgi:hypothetical protein
MCKSITISFLILLVFLASQLMGQDSAHKQDSVYLDLMGFSLWGDIRDMVSDGDYIYCAMSAGVQVFDVADPSNIEIVSQVYLPGSATSIAKQGNCLYVALKNSGFVIIDISEKENPRIIGEYKRESGTGAIAIKGNYVYLGCGLTFEIVDISDPHSPHLINSYNIENRHWFYIRDIVIKDTLVYLAACDFWVLDISNPQQIREVYRNQIPSDVPNRQDFLAKDIEITNGFVYIASEANLQPSFYGGLSIVDISNPSTPEFISTYIVQGDCLNLSASGDYVYVGAGLSGLVVFDVSYPEMPAPIGCDNTPDYFSLESLPLAGDRLAVAQRGYFPELDEEGIGQCDGTQFNKQKIFSRYDNLVIYDISDKNRPKQVGGFPEIGTPGKLVASDGYAYVLDYSGGISIIDISNPQSMRRISYVLPIKDIWFGMIPYANIRKYGNYVYIGREFEGFRIVDVSDPYSPKSVASYNSPGVAVDIAVIDDYIMLADSRSPTQILKLDSLNEVKPVYDLAIEKYAFQIETRDTIAFIGAGNAGLVILNISDPENITEILTIDNDSVYGFAFDVRGGLIAAKEQWKGGFCLIDIKDITNPQIVSHCSTDSSVMDIKIFDDYLLVADIKSGLNLYDISNIHNPVLLDNFKTQIWCTGIEIYDSLIYVADYSNLYQLKICHKRFSKY